MSAWLGILGAADQRLLRAVLLRRRGPLDVFMSTLTRLGDPAAVIAVAGTVGIGAFPGFEGAGQVAVFALVASHIAVQLMKRSIGRPRPALPLGCVAMIASPDRFSFPSGHAAAALSVALPLAMAMPPIVGLPFLGLGFLVGISRCYLGVHYPGDVAMGWLLAASAATTAHWVQPLLF